jgi:transcriptional regulator with XRE-family HTH domain
MAISPILSLSLNARKAHSLVRLTTTWVLLRHPLTQEEMAQRIGVKQPAISKLKNGDRRLTLETLSEIIAALGGEWELNVKLPGNEVMRLTGSEDFAVAQAE